MYWRAYTIRRFRFMLLLHQGPTSWPWTSSVELLHPRIISEEDLIYYYLYAAILPSVLWALIWTINTTNMHTSPLYLTSSPHLNSIGYSHLTRFATPLSPPYSSHHEPVHGTVAEEFHILPYLCESPNTCGVQASPHLPRVDIYYIKYLSQYNESGVHPTESVYASPPRSSGGGSTI